MWSSVCRTKSLLCLVSGFPVCGTRVLPGESHGAILVGLGCAQTRVHLVLGRRFRSTAESLEGLASYLRARARRSRTETHRAAACRVLRANGGTAMGQKMDPMCALIASELIKRIWLKPLCHQSSTCPVHSPWPPSTLPRGDATVDRYFFRPLVGRARW